MSKHDVDDLGPAVAIIGLACRFPGARGISEFWRNLRDGVESIRIFTDDELRTSGVTQETLSDPSYVKAKGMIEGADLFDATFFGFTPR
jgi:acyl transferase domain-containing protein